MAVLMAPSSLRSSGRGVSGSLAVMMAPSSLRSSGRGVSGSLALPSLTWV
jgi:hypothetical protein